jgi:hypothetical protein
MDLQRLRPSRRLIVILVVVAVLLGIRVALPIVITNYANRLLNSVEAIEGHIGDVDLHLWRGAYTVHDIEINQVSGGKPVPMLLVPTIELSVHWRALLHGALVGEVEVYRPEVSIVAGRTRAEQRSAVSLMDRFRQLMPLNVNRFAVIDGQLHFRNLSAQPAVDVFLDDVDLEAHNLTNSEGLSGSLVATVSATGRAMRSGKIDLDMKLDPFAERPTYELAFALEHLNLPELNSFLRHYLAVDARDGQFAMYVESIAKEGRFVAYAKPLVQDLDILRIKQERSVGETIKGFFVKIIDAVFENRPKQQLASRLEFSGSFDNPNVDLWGAIGTFLQNAFVQAIEPGVEGTVAPQQADEVRRRSDERGK